MKVSYKKLWVMLAEKEISKQKFREQLELSTGTMTKFLPNLSLTYLILYRNISNMMKIVSNYVKILIDC